MEKNNQPPIYMKNRELSWLKFNERVLEEGATPGVPLGERLKFIAIYQSNLTEYFMVRVGRLSDYTLLDEDNSERRTGLSPQDQLDMIFARVRDLYETKDQTMEDLEEAFREKGIYHLTMDQVSKEEKARAKAFFKSHIKPVLSPQIVDFHNPFPFIDNNHTHAILRLHRDGKDYFGLVAIPQESKKIIFLNDEKTRYILSEEVHAYYAPSLFKEYTVKEVALIRVTRNGDLSADDEDADDNVDYRDHMKKILKKRDRLNPVGLLSDRPLSGVMTSYLAKELGLSKDQFFVTTRCLDMSYAFALEGALPERSTQDLYYKSYRPKPIGPAVYQPSLMDYIEKNDLILSYPYEDINSFLDLINEAADNENVLSIKITIYRLADHSQLVDALCRAAENGKNVTVLMELKARFDEEHNLINSQVLYDAGCNIVYGFNQYKVHSKVCLISYQKGNDIRTITQVGTGNYNEKTSKQYTDLSFITADPKIGQDATEFFFNICTGVLDGSYQSLLQSPYSIKPTIIDLIRREADKGPKGYIFLKMNSMTDYEIMEELSVASQKGAQVKLIIRGICCIIPGMEGYTDNIEVRSIVGRYLEHPRIYLFGQGDDEIIYITSADLMTRNMERRVEVACPIQDPALRDFCRFYLDTQWKDNVKARRLLENGDYVLIQDGKEPFSCQDYFMERANKRYELALSALENQKARTKKDQPRGLFRKIIHFFQKS